MSTSDMFIDASVKFFEALKDDAVYIRGILGPLDALDCRERAVFIEYHYWNTHMKQIAKSHKISLGRSYEILYRAERKVSSTRAQKEEEETVFES